MSRKRPHVDDFNSLFGHPLNMKKIKEKSTEDKKLNLKKAKKEKKEKNGVRCDEKKGQKKDKKKINKNKDRDKTVKDEPEVKSEPKADAKVEATTDAAEILLSIKTSPTPKKEPKVELDHAAVVVDRKQKTVPTIKLPKTAAENGHQTQTGLPSVPPVVIPKKGMEKSPPLATVPTPSATSPTQLFSSSDSELEGKLDSSLDCDQKMSVHSGKQINKQPYSYLTLVPDAVQSIHFNRSFLIIGEKKMHKLETYFYTLVIGDLLIG